MIIIPQNAALPGWHLSRDTHYQLTNRFAWAWTIAMLGVPVVLIYLGFLQANDMRDEGAPFVSAADWDRLKRIGSDIDLVAVENGGLVLSCSDMFFGHRHNLIMPGRASNMSDGWETKRRRGPGHDWVIIKLAAPGHIHRVEVDTAWFKGNFPESCSLEATGAVDLPEENLTDLSVVWKSVLPRSKLLAHTRHFFESEILAAGNVSHLRFNIFPDGGVSRLRAYGRVE